MIVDRFVPHRHAEVRPSRNWLVFALYVFGFGALLFIGSLVMRRPEDAPFLRTIALVLLAAGFVCVAAYVRFRVHFRSYGIYVYRLGLPVRMIPYAEFARAELGYWAALKLVRRDDTFWIVPMPDHQGGLAEVIWRLRRADLPTPDTIALRNRFGLDEVAAGDRRGFQRMRRRA